LVLLNIASFGMDQDMTQRLLTCKSARDGGRALMVSALVAIPVVWVFISIGQLLHVFYERPDLMGLDMAGDAAQMFNGEKITIFMHYILNQIPAGLKGLVVVGVIAAAISTINSGLNSMSSVIIQDFYRPWTEKRGQRPEQHFVVAGRISMGLVGIVLFSMSVLSYYWQKYTDMPLLEFALSVMVFAYSGLLGVYFTVLFTRRGSVNSVIWALISGFAVTVLLQGYVIDMLHLPSAWKGLAFTWQLCIGTSVAFVVCQLGSSSPPAAEGAIPGETGPGDNSPTG
jgi:Na+/proline symporter